MTYECEENQWSKKSRGVIFKSREEVEKACKEDKECPGYNVRPTNATTAKEGNHYRMLDKEIIRACEGGVSIMHGFKLSCKSLTVCVKKSK